MGNNRKNSEQFKKNNNSYGAAVRCMFSSAWLFVTPWTVVCQAPLFMEFPRQEYWSGLPFPTPEGLSNPGIKSRSPASPALAGRFFTTAPPENPNNSYKTFHNLGIHLACQITQKKIKILNIIAPEKLLPINPEKKQYKVRK